MGTYQRSMATISSAVDSLNSAPMNELRFVQFSLLARTFRLLRGIHTLVRERQPTEAGILTLSLFEVRLDAQYIGANIDRAHHWMTHDSELHQAWTVRSKINELYPRPEERDAQLQFFAFLSQLKHANPRAGSLAFGFRLNGNSTTLSMEDDPQDPIVQRHCRLILFSAITQALQSSGALFRSINCGAQFVEPLRQFLEFASQANSHIGDTAEAFDIEARADTSWITPHMFSAALERWGNIRPRS